MPTLRTEAALFSFLLVAMGVAHAQTPATDVTRLLGQEVSRELPTDPGPLGDAAHVEAVGWKFEVLPGGAVGERFLIDGGWNDVRTLRAGFVQPGAPRYHVKALVSTRGLVLDRGADGILRQRRSGFERRQIAEIATALVRFEMAAEALTWGAVDVVVEAELDTDVAAFDMRDDVRHPFDREDVRALISPTLNTARFDTDDGIYRGPFQSTFVIHATLGGEAHTVLAPSPVTTIPYFLIDDADTGEALVRWMIAGFQQHVRLEAIANGARLTSVPELVRTRSLVANMIPRGLALTAVSDGSNAIERRYTQVEPGQRDISPQDVWQDPSAALPIGPSMPTELEDARAVPLPYADWYADATDAPAIGLIDESPTQMLFAGSGLPTLEELAETGVIGEPTAPGVPALLGGYTSESFVDPGFGAATRFREAELTRIGSASLLAGDPLWTPDSDTVFGGFLKVRTIDDLAISFHGVDGVPLGSVRLTGATPRPSELEAPEMPEGRVAFTADDTWREVAIDPNMLGIDEPIHDVRIGPPFGFERVERLQAGRVSIEATQVRFDTGEGMPIDAPVVRPEWADRILAAQTEGELLALLEELGPEGRLATLDRLASVAGEASLEALVVAAAGVSESAAIVATEALGRIGAFGPLSLLFERGSFGRNHLWAAVALQGTAPVDLEPVLNGALSTESWRERVAIARLLGQYDTRRAKLMLVTRLGDADPRVRAAVVEALAADDDLMAVRLQYTAVNDPSETVRAMAAIKLLESPLPDFRALGLDAAADESAAVRIAIIDRIGDSEDHRDTLRLSVVDADPLVRASTLRAFARLPEPIEAGEIANAFVDSDPRVQQALLDLVERRGLELDAETWTALSNSVDSAVAQRAQALRPV